MQRYLDLVKFSHTIFALPFALLGVAMALYLGANFTLVKLLLILSCMITARTAAMSFNRWLDKEIDKLNIRTKNREIPSGVVTSKQALTLTLIASILFVLCSGFLSNLCLMLSPIALLVILGYSYTKRFTALCHLVLGLGLSLAPIGAFLAMGMSFHWSIFILSMVVFTWVSGFDIIYALQDEDFDKEHKLYSIPAILGGQKAIYTSRILHGIAAILLIILASQFYFSWLFSIGVFIFITSLFWQHNLVNHKNLEKINLAFFTTNGIASVILGILGIVDLIL